MIFVLVNMDKAKLIGVMGSIIYLGHEGGGSLKVKYLIFHVASRMMR
jgi:hypothetical protein